VSEEALAAALENDYEGFLNARSKTLQKHALSLCGESQDGDSSETADPDEVEDSDDDPHA
jgi:hypothetical protein